jgi:hypothetical protein
VRPALAVGALLALLMLYPVLVLTASSQHMNILAGPCMVILGVLCLVLSVGLAGWISGPLKDRSER